MSLSLEIESKGPLSLTAVRAALAFEVDGEPLLAIREVTGGLEVDVHPAAEPIAIAEVKGEHGPRIRIAQRTGTAGAGLHAWLVALIGRIEERTSAPFDRKNARDASDFVRTGDVAALLRFQAAYLSEVAGKILELLGPAHASNHSSIALGMPDDVTFEHEALASRRAVLTTPLGPRDREWLVAVRRDGNKGLDALPWAKPGIDADQLRGTAMALCWTEMRYRAPLDELERARFDRVLVLLEKAYALDPDAAFDWSLWSELFELKGEESLRATRTHLKAERDRTRSTVGYRRSLVTVQVGGGWRIRVPGELATAWERDGRVWVCWDAHRSLHLSTVTAKGAPPTDGPQRSRTEETLAALVALDRQDGEPEGQTMLLKRGPIRGQGTVRPAPPDPENGEAPAGIEVRAISAVGPHGALGTFLLERDDDRTWALETWGTLDHEDARSHQPS